MSYAYHEPRLGRYVDEFEPVPVRQYERTRERDLVPVLIDERTRQEPKQLHELTRLDERVDGPSRHKEPSGNIEFNIARPAREKVVTVIDDIVHPAASKTAIEKQESTRARYEAEQSRRDQFQTICDVSVTRDVTVHFDFPAFEDHDDQIETLSGYRRRGNFREARDLVLQEFGTHLTHPYIFLQYAELLLDMGDYQSFDLLDPLPVFGERFAPRPEAFYMRQSETSRHFYTRSKNSQEELERFKRFEPPNDRASVVIDRPAPALVPAEAPRSRGPPLPLFIPKIIDYRTDDEKPRSSEVEPLTKDSNHLLRWNWRLLKTLCIVRRSGTINEALSEAQFVLHNLVVGPNIGSTEIQIMSLALQIFGTVSEWFPQIIKREVREDLSAWTKWPQLYKSLLAQGRIWDFHDLFLAAIGVFGIKRTCRRFFISAPWRECILDNWVAGERDESTTLAQLGILTRMILELRLPLDGYKELIWLQKDSQVLAEDIIHTFPESMTSRPFLMWMVVKTAESAFVQQSHMESSPHHPDHHFRYWPGCALDFPGWIWLPVYVPNETDIPTWVRPELTEAMNDPIRLALNVAIQNHDYETQVLCLKSLILRTQKPESLFEQLCDLQKEHQDMESYLWTCLSGYAIYRDKASQKRLLAKLKSFDDWTEPWELRFPLCYFAKQYIERALTVILKGDELIPPLRRSNMIYYPWLPENGFRFIGNEFRPDIPASLPSPVRICRSRSRERQDSDTFVLLPDKPAEPKPQKMSAMPEATLAKRDKRASTKIHEHKRSTAHEPSGLSPEIDRLDGQRQRSHSRDRNVYEERTNTALVPVKTHQNRSRSRSRSRNRSRSRGKRKSTKHRSSSRSPIRRERRRRSRSRSREKRKHTKYRSTSRSSRDRRRRSRSLDEKDENENHSIPSEKPVRRRRRGSGSNHDDQIVLRDGSDNSYSTTRRYVVWDESEFDSHRHNPNGFSANFPYFDSGDFGFMLREDELEGKRVTVEVEDEKTKNKDIECSWYVNGENVSLEFKISKPLAEMKELVRSRRRREERRERRRQHHSRSRSCSDGSRTSSGFYLSDDGDDGGGADIGPLPGNENEEHANEAMASADYEEVVIEEDPDEEVVIHERVDPALAVVPYRDGIRITGDDPRAPYIGLLPQRSASQAAPTAMPFPEEEE